MTARTWTLHLPQTVPLSLNQRLHWALKARETSGLRNAAATLCRAKPVPPLEFCTFQLTYQPGTNRRRDVDSLVPTSKACLDGLRDAGVVLDDSPDYVNHLMPRIAPVVRHSPALWFTITDGHPDTPDMTCPSCGRHVGWRKDSQRRKHRTAADNPAAPYCPGGAA